MMPVRNVFSEIEKLYRLVRIAMKIIEREFQIRISDTEVAYIMDNFDTE